MKTLKYSYIHERMIALIHSYFDAAHSGFFDDRIHYVAEKRLHRVELGMFRIEKPYIKRVGARNLTQQRDCSICNVGRGDSAATCGDFGESSAFRGDEGGAKTQEPMGLGASLLG